MPKFSLQALSGESTVSEPLVVDSDIAFDRVNVTLYFDDEPTSWEGVTIRLIGPNGNVFDVPIIRSNITLFFELEEYSEVSSGNWVVKVIDERDAGDLLSVDVRLGFQQILNEKPKPIEI